MKALKYKLFALIIVSAFLATVVPISTHVNAVPADEPTSISKDAQRTCYKKFNGHGSGDGTDGKFVGNLQKDYNKGQCDTSKGGKCTVNSNQSTIVFCTNSDDTGTSNGLSTARDTGDCKASSYKDLNQDNCEMIHIIAVVTKALSGIAGLVIIAMIILGGIQYSAAGPDPSKVQAAKQKMVNALLALLLLVFGFSLLQWLVPGGIF